MPIIRTLLKHENNFTQIPNEWLRDARLSLKAIGLLAQLLSHSQGWSVSIDTLARSNNCGRDLIRAAVAELEEAGYLKRGQNRSGGRFGESVYYTTSPDSPLSGFPMTEKPAAENPTPKNKRLKNTNDKKDYDQDLFNEFWEAYPRKVGKGAALKAFAACLWQANAVAGARRLANDPNLPEPQYIPHPATWLNREGWSDDPYPPRSDKDRNPDLVKAEAAEKRARELARSSALLAEQEELAKAAKPMPVCEHGEKLVFCRTCIQKGANGG